MLLKDPRGPHETGGWILCVHGDQCGTAASKTFLDQTNGVSELVRVRDAAKKNIQEALVSVIPIHARPIPNQSMQNQ
ncbi:hypothetical protein [Bradyrhizobium sp.]|uniref:hypothetical protein n=1 Tax=Bradyrhizobium sp. TaxID=376 RepID=UPI0039E711E3